ncbi:MAG: cytochrome c oxidase subunit 3 [Solirubrobacteraceae bacterium]
MSQVTRSMRARSAAAAAGVARERRAQPNGWWGMALFLCAEVTLFGTLLATYFYLDFDARAWPPAHIKAPSVALPLIATAVLITTSVPMLLAARAARAGLRSRTAWMLGAALVVQCCYLAAQVLLFIHDYNQFSPQATAYGSIYFTMLAVHHAHVLLGILLVAGVLWRVSTGGLTNYRVTGVRTVALYWHVVNALAVFVVLTQLSPSL